MLCVIKPKLFYLYPLLKEFRMDKKAKQNIFI